MAPALARWTDEGAAVLVEPIDDPIQRVTVAVVQSPGELPVELVAPTPGLDSPVAARLRRGGGLDHFCYTVANVGNRLEQETERGAVVVCPPVFAIAFGREIGFVQRRTGLVVEFVSEQEMSPV